MNPLALADLIRERAKRYELSAIAARDRNELDQALAWSTVAVTLYELENALLDLERRERQAA